MHEDWMTCRERDAEIDDAVYGNASLEYPEERRYRVEIDKERFVDAPRLIDIEAAERWSLDIAPHKCEHLGVIDCVRDHYNGGWPAFIREVVGS